MDVTSTPSKLRIVNSKRIEIKRKQPSRHVERAVEDAVREWCAKTTTCTGPEAVARKLGITQRAANDLVYVGYAVAKTTARILRSGMQAAMEEADSVAGEIWKDAA